MLKRFVVQQRSCFTKVDGRDVAPGYTGGAGEGWPVFPSDVTFWSDDDAAKYLFTYNSVISKTYESPGRPYNVTKRSPILRRINEDLHKLEHLGVSVGPQTYCTYVELMSRAGVMGHLTRSIPDQLVKKGYTPCIRVYNSLLQGFARAGRLSDFRKTRLRMMSDNVNPNVFTYNSTMTLFLQRKQFDLVRVLYQEMLVTGVHPNSITFDKILSAAPSFQASLSIFTHDMVRLNINPRPTHFVGMFASCRSEGPETMVQSGKKVMDLLLKSGFKATADHYDAYAHIYKELGDMKGLEQVMHERVSNGIPLTATSSVIYISACAGVIANEKDVKVKEELIGSAEKCFQFAVHSGHQGYRPLYTEMLRLYAEGKCLQKASNLVKTMRGSLGHIRESTSVLLVLHRLYSRCGRTDLTHKTRQQLVNRWQSLGYSQQTVVERLQLSVSHTSRHRPGSKRPEGFLFRRKLLREANSLDTEIVSDLVDIVNGNLH